MAPARCVSGAARLSASAFGEVSHGGRRGAVECVQRVVALAIDRFSRGCEHGGSVQQRPAGAVGTKRGKGARAGVHDADFGRRNRSGLVEPVATGERTVAVCDAIERNDAVFGGER